MRKKGWVVLMLAVLTCLLCACGAANDAPAPTEAPTSAPFLGTGDTANDRLALIQAVLATTKAYQPAKDHLLAALPDAVNAEVPFGNAERLAGIVTDNRLPEQKNGEYVYSLSSGGSFVYERPYADVTYGSNTDTYVVSDTGEPYEAVENVKYDPLSFVLSGEGGGNFAYASYYILSADGARGEQETVSRLDEAVTGYSHYEYALEGGALSFIDVQLSLSNDQTEGPYTWAVLLGVWRADGADILEFTLQTSSLALPEGLPKVYETRAADVAACAQSYAGSTLSRLTLSENRARLTTRDGTAEASIQ